MAFIPDDALRKRHKAGLTPAAWAVYEAHCMYRNHETGFSWGTKERIASEFDIALGTVRNATTELRQKGWIDETKTSVRLLVGDFSPVDRRSQQRPHKVAPAPPAIPESRNQIPDLVNEIPESGKDFHQIRNSHNKDRARDSNQPYNQHIEPAKAIGADAPPVAKILPYPTAKSETDHQRMMRELTQRTGAIPDGAAQGKAAKWLLEHGYTVEQCVECLEALLAESWRSHRISWLTVQKEIGTFLAKGRQHGLNARYGTSGGRDHAEIGRRQSTRPERTEQALSERDYDALFATN
jgi:hypothetical protein